MPYVITEKCLGEQYGDCVDVCPVECIHPVEHEGKPFMVIDPDASASTAASACTASVRSGPSSPPRAKRRPTRS